MSTRTSILLTSAGAALTLILLVTAGAWILRGDASEATRYPDNGSLLHPQVMREDRSGYVIAELYQDAHLDIQSGVYAGDGSLQDRYWNHDAATQTCSLDLVLADQHGRDEIAPTATPMPPDPTATPALVVLPAIWVGDTPTMVAPDRIVTAVPPTPVNTPTPYPTATPTVVSATGWDHWKGRPIAIETEGLAVVDAPRDTSIVAYLSLRVGADSGNPAEIARLPLPDASWENGSAYLRLGDASGRILLDNDRIDTHYRAAVLHLEAAPLTGCGGLRLRWQRAAVVVVKALTDNPFSDWGGRAAPPPTPSPRGVAVYAAVGADSVFAEADYLAGSSSTVLGHIRIPAAATDSHISFAVRSDLDPNAMPDIRQAGSAFNSRLAFVPEYNPMTQVFMHLSIQGIEYNMYDSLQAWDPSLLGGDWSLTP